MTDETIDTTSDETTEVDGPKQLREALKRSQADNAKLTTQLMGRAYTEAGLDTTSGLGKAISKEYKGEPTSEALLAFAKEEYGYEPQVVPDNPHAQVIYDEQRKLDGVQAVSGSTVPLNESEVLRQAEQSGDLKTAGSIKAARLRAMKKPR
jgi:hypothetical protein